MELIRISDQKLKIMLTPADMTQFQINTETLEDDSEQMHRAFRLLLREVRQRIDFDVEDKQLSVQYFPSREGGCEMFVSCGTPCGQEQHAEKHRLPVPRAGTLPVRAKPLSGSFRREGAYRFETLDRLLSVCKRLRAIGYIGESAAYRDESHRYYLLLTTLSSTPFTVPEELGFLVEYGEIENASVIRVYIREHGTPICAPDAVERLARLA